VTRVEVRSAIPGAAGLPAVLIELAAERTTARELISRAVAEQIRLLRADLPRCRAALDRQYLTAEEIRAQAAGGAVKLPAPPVEPDVAAEVARAHRAFGRGAFVLLVGGRQVEELDEEIVLRLGEPVVFLRLTPLMGG
jgi:hypothetical protein